MVLNSPSFCLSVKLLISLSILNEILARYSNLVVDFSLQYFKYILPFLYDRFLIAQLVKNLPVMQETWVQSLGWKDPLENRKATHSSILAWRIPWTVQSMGRKESDTTEQLSLHIPFWPEEFSLKDQLLNVWGFPFMLLIAFPLLLLIFFLCV